MGKKRPTTRAERRAKNVATIPARFTPKFWEDADKRQAIIKKINRMVARLKQNAGVDSYQKEMIAEEAVFIHIQLQHMRRNALESPDDFDLGVYTQGVNALSGLLSKLGLDQSEVEEAFDLSEYVNGRR